jgi:hypothetical protein
MATRLESGQAQLRSASGVPIREIAPQQIDFIGPRAEARTSEILAQNIDRMTAAVIAYGGEVRQREALQFVIAQPPTPEQMLAAKEGDITDLVPPGDFTKFDKAVRKSRGFQLAERFGAQSRIDIIEIAEKAAAGQITPEDAKREIESRIRGYTASLAQADGEAALRFEASATADGHVAYKTALDAQAKKKKEQDLITFRADSDNRIKVYKLLTTTNPELAPQYEDLFRSLILKSASLHGPEVFKEFQGLLQTEFAAARQNVLLQHLSDEAYLSNPRLTFKQLNSGVYDPPGTTNLFQKQEIKSLIDWMRVNDGNNLRDTIAKFGAMAQQRKQGIDLALVDAEQNGKELLRKIHRSKTISEMNVHLGELLKLPVDPSLMKQAKDYISELSKPKDGKTNLVVFDNYIKSAKNGSLNISKLNADPNISQSDKQSLVSMNANPSSTLSNGFKNIEFSGGQTSEFLPPNFDSAEGKRIASNAIATQKQALLNYAQTPDAKGNYPSGADITKKANELSDGVKILLGRSFLQEAQSQKNTAELLVPELKGVDLNNSAAVEKAIQQATKNNRKSNDINAAQSAIKKYKDAINNAPKEQK